MRQLASEQEVAEATAQQESLMAMRSTDLARAKTTEADTVALTARRLQSMSETFLAGSPSVEQGLTKLRTSLTNVQEELNKRAVCNQQLQLEFDEACAEHAEVKRQSDISEEMSRELQEHVQQLMLASSAACEIRNAEASLDGCQEELETLSSQLQTGRSVCQQISTERDTQLNEAKTEGLLVEELRCTSRQLELKLQRAEAKLHTQDRRYRQEREEWHRKLRQMQLSELHSESEVVEVVEPLDVSLTAKNEAWTTRKAQLQKELGELESELEAAKRRDSLQRNEAEARHQADEIRKDALLQEVNSARGHVAALAQEIDRLQATREAKTGDKAEKISDAAQREHRADRAARSDPKRKHLERLLAQQEKRESQLTEQIDASKKADPYFKSL